jgi:hypothetical protein
MATAGGGAVTAGTSLLVEAAVIAEQLLACLPYRLRHVRAVVGIATLAEG